MANLSVPATIRVALVTLVALAGPFQSAARPDAVPAELWSKILEEATQRSRVRDTLIELSDVHGPRLLGTKNYYDAAVWSRDALRRWGLPARLDPLTEHYRGWMAETVSVSLVDPAGGPLAAFPVAWSGSTDGPIEGTPLTVDVDSLDDLDALREYGDVLRDRMLLLQSAAVSGPNFGPTAERWQSADLTRAQRSATPTPVPGFYYTPRQSFVSELAQRAQETNRAREVQAYLRKQGVSAVLIPSILTHGLLYVESTLLIRPADLDPVPQIVLADEHAGRLHRLIARGSDPRVRVDVRTRFIDNPAYNANVLGEIAGTAEGGEFVLIGAHLDSEAAGAGAIDNGSGSAVMLEAMRILSVLDVHPIRSIRIALWAGEEQGYAGSRDYAQKYIGDIETGAPGPDHEEMVAYLNLDHGTGLIRGIFLQGNDAWRPLFEQILAPFRFAGASTVTLESTRGTDHVVFDALNVPAFQFIQDLINLDTVTGHTHIDSVEHALEEDLQLNAAIVAFAALQIANATTLPARRDQIPSYD